MLCTVIYSRLWLATKIKRPIRLLYIVFTETIVVKYFSYFNIILGSVRNVCVCRAFINIKKHFLTPSKCNNYYHAFSNSSNTYILGSFFKILIHKIIFKKVQIKEMDEIQLC